MCKHRILCSSGRKLLGEKDLQGSKANTEATSGHPHPQAPRQRQPGPAPFGVETRFPCFQEPSSPLASRSLCVPVCGGSGQGGETSSELIVNGVFCVFLTHCVQPALTSPPWRWPQTCSVKAFGSKSSLCSQGQPSGSASLDWDAESREGTQPEKGHVTVCDSVCANYMQIVRRSPDHLANTRSTFSNKKAFV